VDYFSTIYSSSSLTKIHGSEMIDLRSFAQTLTFTNLFDFGRYRPTISLSCVSQLQSKVFFIVTI